MNTTNAVTLEKRNITIDVAEEKHIGDGRSRR